MGVFTKDRGGAMRHSRHGFLVFLLLLGYTATGLAAQSRTFDEKAVANFYRNKTLRIIVGFTAGGGYDQYSRLIGRHLSKYIPGNPNVIVDNMAGAGSIIAANHVYHAAPKDGTVVGNISGPIILEQLFANPAIQFVHFIENNFLRKDEKRRMAGLGAAIRKADQGLDRAERADHHADRKEQRAPPVAEIRHQHAQRFRQGICRAARNATRSRHGAGKSF